MNELTDITTVARAADGLSSDDLNQPASRWADFYDYNGGAIRPCQPVIE